MTDESNLLKESYEQGLRAGRHKYVIDRGLLNAVHLFGNPRSYVKDHHPLSELDTYPIKITKWGIDGGDFKPDVPPQYDWGWYVRGFFDGFVQEPVLVRPEVGLSTLDRRVRI